MGHGCPLTRPAEGLELLVIPGVSVIQRNQFDVPPIVREFCGDGLRQIYLEGVRSHLKCSIRTDCNQAFNAF